MELPVQLQSGEEVIKLIRRHPASLWGRLGLIALVVILALIIWLIAGGNTLFNIIFALVVIGGILVGFMAWYRYFNDLWVITTARLIDVTRSNPFSQQVTTAALSNVQDINIRKKGVFNTMLNFGDVICQTASASGQTFSFVGVAEPEKVLDLIDEARNKAKAAR